MSGSRTATILLRIGLAFALFYAAIAGFLTPSNWVGFLPSFTTQFAPEETVLLIFGVVEVVLAVLVLFLKKPLYPAIITAVLLSGMVIFNLGAIDIVFRDVSLALAALALATLSKNNYGRKKHATTNSTKAE